ncbi:isoaspartyl peptidase/L-asparaginase, partial [Brevundimonas sp.]|uniref:isoaspartyl peptidase/L-asparaginase family protein n=1 Tax=Brevundimonas sp. TaxID=1871086 RepID=UPI0025D93D71
MMKLATCAALALLSSAGSAAAQEAEARWTIALHGGAGTIARAQMTPERDAEYRAALTAALEAGSQVLRNGGSALDAVQAAIELMEDDPLFNAGRGAVFTTEGTNSLDAAIMDGETMAAGSVAGASRTRHPIALARAVMERSPHVMLSGEGADVFAASVGLEQVEPAYFFTERRWGQLLEVLSERGVPHPARPAGAPPAPGASASLDLDDHRFGTVGVVALDSQGRIAAGTSTGGTTAKRWGRIGDAPIIGAGTYADQGCAVSA